jgi:hypothetical protein
MQRKEQLYPPSRGCTWQAEKGETRVLHSTQGGASELPQPPTFTVNFESREQENKGYKLIFEPHLGRVGSILVAAQDPLHGHAAEEGMPWRRSFQYHPASFFR